VKYICFANIISFVNTFAANEQPMKCYSHFHWKMFSCKRENEKRSVITDCGELSSESRTQDADDLCSNAYN